MAQLKAAQGDPKALAAIMAAQSGGGGAGEDDGGQGEAPKAGGGKDGIPEEEVEEMKKQMEERLKRNQEEMDQMKKSWEQRLKEEHKASESKESEMKKEHEMKKTTSHLWNLNEDPQLTNMIVHFLKPGNYRIGNRKATPAPDILLNGLSIQAEHCKVEHDGKSNKIFVMPGNNAKILLNGVNLVEKRELHHDDRIMFGNNHLFVLHHPKDADLIKKKAEAKKKGVPYDESPPSFEKAQEEIAQNSGLLNFGDVTKADGTDGKKSKEEILLQEDLLKLLPMINEANAMSEELDKKVSFEPVLVSPQARGEKDGRTIVHVKMKDLTNGNEWVWDKNKFINRKYIMQEMYQNFTDGDPDWQVPKEKDPFWEAPDSEVLIGSVHLYLQSLAYKIELDENLAITDYKGNEQGHLQVKILPCEKNGNECDEDDFVEDPKELIGQSLHCKVHITGARGLPKKFAKGESFCKYKLYMEEKEAETSKVKNTINPDYKHAKIFSFSPVTKLFVDYMQNSPLVIDIWGKQSAEVDPRAQNKSTRQLMNQDQNVRNRTNQSSSSKAEEERYKMLCDISTYKRRAERMAGKMNRIQKLLESSKGQIKTSDLEAIMKGPDRTEMQRFHAAADVVLHGEKLKHDKAKKGDTPGSKACTIQ